MAAGFRDFLKIGLLDAEMFLHLGPLHSPRLMSRILMPDVTRGRCSLAVSDNSLSNCTLATNMV